MNGKKEGVKEEEKRVRGEEGREGVLKPHRFCFFLEADCIMCTRIIL